MNRFDEGALCGDGKNPKSTTGKPDLAIVSGNDQTTVVGDTIAEPLVVLLTDKIGNPLANRRIDFAAHGDVELIQASVLTDEFGSASAHLIAGDSTGVVNVSARAFGSETTTSFTIIIVGRTPQAILIVEGTDQVAFMGEALPVPLRVQIIDERGRPVSGSIVLFRVSEGDAAVNPMRDTTSEDGFAQTTLMAGNTVKSRVVRKSEGKLLDASSVRLPWRPPWARGVRGPGNGARSRPQ